MADYLPFVAAIVAVLSLILSSTTAYFYFRDRRLGLFEIENQYSRELLEWHSQVVKCLVALRLGAQRGPQVSQKELAALSALIEQGRFFLPNIDKKDSFGMEKPAAYQGYRNLGLDFLVASFNLFSNPIVNGVAGDAETLQRHFTSIVFKIVRPKIRLEQIREITDRYFAEEKTFEDFLSHKDGKALSYLWH